MDESYVDVLQREFSAEEGTFLLTLHPDLVWDKAAFTRLTEAMRQCCQAYSLESLAPTLLGDAYDKSVLPRWIAQGFWYAPSYARDWTSHPAWAATVARDPDYYTAAYQRLEDLALWFFTGETGRKNPMSYFTPM